jgi:hypothetical protein
MGCRQRCHCHSGMVRPYGGWHPVQVARFDAAEWPLFLGGTASPTGCGVTFMERPVDVVLEAVVAVRADDPVPHEVIAPRPLPGCLEALDPMEAPWTTELVVDCGDWTAYLNNGLDGGDIAAIAPAVAHRLDARCIVSQHIGQYWPGHAATQSV